MHTNIMIFIILELFISFRAYPKRRKGLLGLTVFMISYLIWIHVIKYYSGVWVYPVLDVLNFPLRLAFFVLILAITLSLYILGEFLNSRIWAKELKQLSKKSNQLQENLFTRHLQSSTIHVIILCTTSSLTYTLEIYCNKN